MKERPGDIILHKCTKNNDHMLYCFNLGNFSSFNLLTAQRMKISKKWKKHLEVSSFNTNVPEIMIICYNAPEIGHMAVAIVIFYFFWLFLALYPIPPPPPLRPNSLKNKKFKKMKKKKYLEISFYISVPKILIICCNVPEIWCMTDVNIFHFGLFFALLPP